MAAVPNSCEITAEQLADELAWEIEGCTLLGLDTAGRERYRRLAERALDALEPLQGAAYDRGYEDGRQAARRALTEEETAA